MNTLPGDLWAAFLASVEYDPARAALALADGDIDFAELLADAERAAGWLAASGIEKGMVVALQLFKRRESYALWLACLRQGAPYVFLDPQNPDFRTERILARLRPALLVTAGALENPFGRTLRFVGAEDGAAWLAGLDDCEVPPPARCHGLEPAYVMFTSGSTGEPKGAVIPRQGVLSLMRWVRSAVVADFSLARFSNLNPLHFDNSVFDLYGGLVNGATLVPVDTARSPNPAQWVKRIRDGAANVIFAVPTLYQTLDRLSMLTPQRLPSATIFLFGGEGYPIASLAAFHRRFDGSARLINVYGPTETSCICSSIVVDRDTLSDVAAAGAGVLPLGRMHADFDHAILNEYEQPVPLGAVGELWIGGTNVGLGYFNNPEETTRRFRQDPRQCDYRSIYYRSGDLVSEDETGLLWFRGRVDNQVKLRGHRIELEEVDLAVEAFPGILRAVTAVVGDGDQTELRVGFLAEDSIDVEALRAHSARTLPHYMQPACFARFDRLPMNANGKVDRAGAMRLLQRGDGCDQ